MNLEIWTEQKKGNTEIHHFLEGEQNTYVFGINADLLGHGFYLNILRQIEARLEAIKQSPFSYALPEGRTNETH